MLTTVTSSSRLDPSNADDRNLIVSKDGYTALEAYLCSLMGENIKFKK